ncbi:MAG: glycosyltransferase, partial [Chloroflexi bacterium]
VVASRVAGLPLVVAEGETGLLVPERDPVALADAVSHLLQHPDLRRRFGEAGRQRVLQELNWEAVARRFLALYQSAYQRGRA